MKYHTNKGLVDMMDKDAMKSTKSHHESSSSSVTAAAAATATGASAATARPKEKTKVLGKKKKMTKTKQKKITIISGRLDENSVLEGRGTKSNDNPGNVKFRNMVSKIRAQYVSTPSRKEKNDIVLNLVRTIQKRRGRFVRQVDSSSIIRLGLDPKQDHFLPMTDAEAIAKTKQAIRYFHYKKVPSAMAAAASGGGSSASLGLVAKNETQKRSPNQNKKRNSNKTKSMSKQGSSAARLQPSLSPTSLSVHEQQQQNQHLSSRLGAGWDALPSQMIARTGQQHQYGLSNNSNMNSIDQNMFLSASGPSSSSSSSSTFLPEASLRQLLQQRIQLSGAAQSPSAPSSATEDLSSSMNFLPSRLTSPPNSTSGGHRTPAPSLIALDLLQRRRGNKSSDVDRELLRLQQEQQQQRQMEDLQDRLRSVPTPAVAQLLHRSDMNRPPPNMGPMSGFSDRELHLMQESQQHQLKQQQLQQKLLLEEIMFRDRMRSFPGAGSGQPPPPRAGPGLLSPSLLSQLSGNQHGHGQQNSAMNQDSNRFIVDPLPPPRTFQSGRVGGGTTSTLPLSLQQLQHGARQRKPSLRQE